MKLINLPLEILMRVCKLGCLYAFLIKLDSNHFSSCLQAIPLRICFLKVFNCCMLVVNSAMFFNFWLIDCVAIQLIGIGAQTNLLYVWYVDHTEE